MDPIKNSLKQSEWLLVGSLLLIMASLVLLSKWNSRQAACWVEAQTLKPVEKIEIEIAGAVARPGIYQVFPGTLVSQALKKARPKALANLKKWDAALRISEPQKFVVEELVEISVLIVGAVEERLDLKVAPQTRVCDLKTKVRFADADPEFVNSFFKQRRRLKEGEKIVVPKKTG